MPHFKRYLFCTVISTLVSSQTLDIKTLKQLVINKNPQIVSANKQISIQTGKLEQSKLFPNPTVEFESGKGDDPESVGMIFQPIPLGGKRKQNLRQKELQVKRAEIDFEIVKQSKVSEALKIFTNILFLQKTKSFQEELISISNDLLTKVDRKVKAGKLSSAERSRVKIQLYHEKLNLSSTEKSIETYWNTLRSFWGNENGYLTIAEGKLENVPEIPQNVGLENSLEIQLSNVLMEIKKVQVQIEKAEVIPDLSLGTGMKQNEHSGNTFQIGMSIPLPVFNRNQGNINSAIFELEQSSLNHNTIESQLYLEIRNLKAELGRLNSEIEILKENIIPEDKGAYTIITDGYLNGRFTYLDVVDAQKMWFQSREQYIKALKYYHTYFFELDRITGVANHTHFRKEN